MKRLLSISVSLLLIAFFSNFAFSALVEKDLYQQNDRLITLDTISGFEWLDITYTKGMSYQDVWSDSLLIAESWHHATNFEVQNLFNQYLRIDNLGQIQNYFGITMEIYEPNAFRIAMTHGFILSESTYGDAFIRNFLAGGESNWEVRNFGIWDPNQQEPNVGHWMVRQSAVPIPAAVWLLGSGIFVLFTVRTRINKKN